MERSYTPGTPGVHIRHVLTEPERVMHTGVPLFLGLIRQADLATYNDQQSEQGEIFIVKPTGEQDGVGIARKRGYVRLPERARQPTSDSFSLELSNLHVASTAPKSAHITKQVLGSYGAAGQPGPAVDDDEIMRLSDKPQRFMVWPQFAATYGGLRAYGFLSYAVQGFFENGGRLCYVQLIAYTAEPHQALKTGLESISHYDDYDLICVPDLMWPHGLNGIAEGTERWKQILAMQNAVITHCEERGERFALLDALPTTVSDGILAQRHELSSPSAALYYPWVRIIDGPQATAGYLPPCGHVAGVIARTDRLRGVYKAPANELLEGVVDLAVTLTDEQQEPLNETGINCLRSFLRRGIRVWGARTLSTDAAWTFINARRIFITAVRWIERNMNHILFEPHTPDLWRRIVRDLTNYFTTLLEQGALVGGTAEEAFYIKCDAETNPPEVREVGQVVTEIGLATTVPMEFIVIRIMHGPTGVRIV